MLKEDVSKNHGGNERERERESKRLRRFVTSFLLILSLILQNFLFLVNPVYAASSPWAQTDWVGGSGQTSWSDATKFSSSSNVTTSTANQITLATNSGWYNTSWKYRQSITLTNSGLSLMNYQVYFLLDTSTLINASKMQSDCDDIRVANSSGTILPHWIETDSGTCNTSSTKIWTKVDSIPAGSSTIYVYYGNSSASNGQSGAGVFDFFDDFESYSFGNIQGQGGWTGTSPLASTAHTNVIAGQSLNVGNTNGLDNKSPYAKHTITNSNTGDILFRIKKSTNSAHYSYFGLAEGLSARAYIILSANGTIRYSSSSTPGYPWSSLPTATSYIANQWYTIRIKWYSNNTFDIWVDGTSKGTGLTFGSNMTSGIDTLSMSTGQNSEPATIDAYYDTILLRQMASTEPIVGVPSFEEQTYVMSGTLTSSIFDTEQQSNWGTLTYNTDGVATTAVKARTSNSSSMTGATDFASCNAITSGTDVSSNNCVTDTHRYIQYQVSLTSVSANTPTFQDVSIAFTASDSTPPSISLTALSPDPNNDNTPSLTGTATDTGGTVNAVQYQMDGTSGSWTACTADDGSFNSASEAFTCTSSTLSDGSHTMYVRATDSNGNTTSDVNASTDTFTIDTTGTTVSVTAFTPDLGADNTPTVSGSVTATIGTISNVQFQVDSTTGTWTNCTATDGLFNSATESFSCTTSALSDGSHTIYVRGVDNASNNSSNASDTFTIDTTAPASFDLDSPGDNSYTNSERPSFKWKATTDATSGLSKYSIEIDNGDSGDFSIDDIPTSRTTDYETNKYVAHYENFSDSDSTNNYISVYTKSTNDWGSDPPAGGNDGKLKEGKRNWKVKARDNAGNERSESRTLFVDRISPSVETTQINDTKYSSNGFMTNDKTPTIYGKITDSLAGDKTDNKVSSGPKNIEVKIEKKNNLGLYDLQTLATINLNETYWTSDNSKITDNSQNKSDKYSTFEFTPKTDLPLGNYRVIITGKDNADNSGSAGTFYLNIVTYEQVTTPEEKKIVEEALRQAQGEKPLKPEEKEKFMQELEITKPTEPVKPSALEKTVDMLTAFRDNLFKATINLAQNISSGIGKGITIAFNGLGNGAKFIIDNTGRALAFAGDKAGKAIAFVSLGIQKTFNGISQGLAFTKDKAGETIAFIGKTASSQIAALYNSTQSIVAYVVNAVGQGTEVAFNTIASGLTSVSSVIASGSEAISKSIKIAASSAYGGFLAMTNAINQGVAFAGQKTGQGINATSQTVGQGLAYTSSVIASGSEAISKSIKIAASSRLAGFLAMTNNIGQGYNDLANNAPGVAKTILIGVREGITTVSKGIVDTSGAIAITATSAVKTTASAIGNVSVAVATTTATLAQKTGSAIASVTNTIASTAVKIAQNTVLTLGNAASSIASTTATITQNTGNLIVGVANNIGKTTSSIAQKTSETIGNTWNNIATTTSPIAQNTGSVIAHTSQKAVNSTKAGIANIAFAVGEKTQDVSDTVGLAIIQFTYNFVNEPTKISNVQVAIVSPTSAKISWVTNHPANGKVNYGLDETYPIDVQSEKRVSYHEFTLTNLQPDTQYYFEVMSQNRNYVYDANRKFKTPAK